MCSAKFSLKPIENRLSETRSIVATRKKGDYVFYPDYNNGIECPSKTSQVM